jgi:hypothetical protein
MPVVKHGVPVIRSRHLSNPGAPLILFAQKMPMVGLELCAAFIERDGMAEVAHGSIGGREWEGMRDQPNSTNRIPTAPRVSRLARRTYRERIPDADEFDLDVGRESFLEHGALFPASIVILNEHLVRERNLLVVARREKAHLGFGQITCNPIAIVGEGVHALWIMPASARAMYAPRENPNMHILSSA